jgi:hypothetical protein
VTTKWSRVVIWRLLDGSGWEYCKVSTDESQGYDLRYQGKVIAVESAQPVMAGYGVLIDQASGRWRVSMTSSVGANGSYWTYLERDPDGTWRRVVSVGKFHSLEPDPALRGAAELDIEFSPLTNTLALNRLNLAIGESAELVTAWVRFPTLTVEPYPQRYTRLTERTYRFESEGFEAEIEVDDLNLVVRYGDLWERIAVSDGDAGRPDR